MTTTPLSAEDRARQQAREHTGRFAAGDGPVMVQRNLRVPVGLWDRAKSKAAQETPKRDISAVVRDLLTAYTADEAR